MEFLEVSKKSFLAELSRTLTFTAMIFPMSCRSILSSLIFSTLLLASACAQDLELLASKMSRWPKQVTALANITYRNSGGTPLTIPSGTELEVISIQPTGIEVDYNGSSILVQAEKTDLSKRLDEVVSSPGPSNAPKPPGKTVKQSTVFVNSLSANLVDSKGRRIVNIQDFKNKDYYALYFSAHWCGPCRAFTPKLVQFYNEMKAKTDNFEIVFYSYDRSAQAMEDYMKEANMPWPAISYDQREAKQDIASYAGNGIPCLVLVDRNGKVISDSYEGERYIGPGEVVEDLSRLLAN